MTNQKSFTVDQTALRSVVALCAGFTEAKATIPVLSQLHFRVEQKSAQLGENNGELRVTATDLDTSYSAPIQIQNVTRDFCFTMPGRKMAGYINLLPSSVPLSIEVESNQWATMRHPKGRCRVPGLDPSSFPEIPNAHISEPVEIPLALIVGALRRATIAVLKLASRNVLPGSLLELTPEGVVVVSTDGHRVCWNLTPIRLNISRVVIGHEGIAAILKLADSSKAETATFSVDGRTCHVRAGGHFITTRTVDGVFPQYEKAMPRKYGAIITLNRLELLEKIGLAKVVDTEWHTVVLSLSDGQLDVTAEASVSSEGEASSEVDSMFDCIAVDYEGAPFKVAFEIAYVEQFLRVCEAEKVIVKFNETAPGTSAVEFNEDGNPNTRYVVMPKRTFAKATAKPVVVVS